MRAPRATRSCFPLQAFWVANIYILVKFGKEIFQYEKKKRRLPYRLK